MHLERLTSCVSAECSAPLLARHGTSSRFCCSRLPAGSAALDRGAAPCVCAHAALTACGELDARRPPWDLGILLVKGSQAANCSSAGARSLRFELAGGSLGASTCEAPKAVASCEPARGDPGCLGWSRRCTGRWQTAAPEDLAHFHCMHALRTLGAAVAQPQPRHRAERGAGTAPSGQVLLSGICTCRLRTTTIRLARRRVLEAGQAASSAGLEWLPVRRTPVEEWRPVGWKPGAALDPQGPKARAAAHLAAPGSFCSC